MYGAYSASANYPAVLHGMLQMQFYYLPQSIFSFSIARSPDILDTHNLRFHKITVYQTEELRYCRLPHFNPLSAVVSDSYI